MIKFILDYSKLGVSFSFSRCENCGLINILITKSIEISEGVFLFNNARTCVSDKEFIDEDLMIKEIAEAVKNITNS
jgi:hypothetical protein